MRKFSAEVQALLQMDSVTGFFLVQWGTGVETFSLKHTSFPYDLYITDVDSIPIYRASTFLANNGLVSLDAPRLSDVLDREVYKIAYIDNDLYMFNIIRSQLGLYGAPCTVWIGLINTTQNTLDGYAPGEPLADYRHLIMAYHGAVDTYGISVDIDGALTTSFELASPMAALDIVRPVLTSSEYQKQWSTYDTCYDALHINPASTILRWGKL